MNSSLLPPAPDAAAIEQALQAIGRIDLTNVARRLQRDRPEFVPDRLATAVTEYQRFLILILLYPDEELMPPTYDSDQVWHGHLLHSGQYRDDCEATFGYFIDHEPADGPAPPGLRERSLALYRSLFGSNPTGLTDDW